MPHARLPYPTLPVRAALPVFLLSLLMACGSPDTPDVAGTPVTFRHASLLRVQRTDSFTVCDVMNPWREGTLLHRYVLVPRARKQLPSSLPEGTLVRTPLRRAVAFSSVHASLLCDLGAAESLCGVCDYDYIVRDDLRKAVAEGRMADMGAAHLPDAEKIVAARADALLVSPFENAGYAGVEGFNIPLIECADYMETSPLGRAEWMRFYGLLFGCEARADSIFRSIEAAYNNLAAEAANAPARPRLLVDNIQGGAWYVPGGSSTMGRIFRDAGADYCFDYLPGSGSVTLSFETIFSKARNADIWLIKYGAATDLTYAQMAADYAPYREFRAWRERRIWQCNVSHTPFFEDTPFHPERLLADLVRIFHPDFGMPTDSAATAPHYFTPMQ